MNVAALSLVSADRGELMATLILDEAARGAANPYSAAWTSDGGMLCITHAGTHELSVIDFRALERKLSGVPTGSFVADFGVLKGIRTRLALGVNGPRSLAIDGGIAYVPGFFSDSVAIVTLGGGTPPRTLLLGGVHQKDTVREGERLFNDATICHQGWQSCATCHPEGRADGLNWDLLNDGIGNPKNTKSLLSAHKTPPSMSLGVRGSAEEAVRSGLKHILFAYRPESEARAIDDYLRSLRPTASPHLLKGALSPSAWRGKRLFSDPNVGCVTCHPPPLFTDCRPHQVAHALAPNGRALLLDTPTLVECWRTAPYLHDGSAASIEEVLVAKNLDDLHGRTSHLSPGQVQDLIAYVLAL